MRPYIIDNRRHAMPIVHAQTGLQRVVVRACVRLQLVNIFGAVGIIPVGLRNAVRRRDATGAASEDRARKAGGVGVGSRKIGRGDGRLARLIQIQIVEQAVPLRAYVPYLQYDLARNLLLHVEVVVLHVWSWKIPANRENVAAWRTAGRFEY